MSTPKLLLHICCGPCGGGCIERLLAEKRDFSLYYSNSNLVDQAEFDRRLAGVEKLAAHYDIPLEVDPYRHDDWQQCTRGLESAPEGGARCAKCFFFNLRRTAQRAEKLNCAFATTLTVSPRKNSALIFAAGNACASAASPFEAWDFKKQNGYAVSCRIARELELYRQDFCGCRRREAPGSLPISAETPTSKE